MRRRIVISLFFAAILMGSLSGGRQSWAQSFGIELHNTLMPASGGMGGASIAKPQDLLSAIAGNPATLAQFRGTNVTFGGGWVESTYNLSHTGGILPNLGQFSAKSEAEGSVLGNIGVTHDLDVVGLPATWSIGLLSTAGAGLSYRDVPASNGTSVSLAILELGSGVGVNVTDRLAVGATMTLGSATFDAPFQGIGAATLAYALRGSVGLNYDIGCATSVGTYYASTQNFNFDDAIRLQDVGGFSPVADIDAGLPDNIGFGIANSALLDGQLLLAADVLYKQWDNADLFGDLYNNQWVLQLGAQYTWQSRVHLRLGYAYAENPIDTTIGQSAGGVIPPGPAARVEAALQYVQGTVAIINEHRISCGAGVRDVLPGVDFDLFAGGMFDASQQLGQYTAVDVKGYWLGAGLTWHFGGGCADEFVPCGGP